MCEIFKEVKLDFVRKVTIVSSHTHIPWRGKERLPMQMTPS